MDRDEIVDAVFAIECRSLPVDHAYALSTAIQEALPWFADEPQAALHTVHGAASGAGWQRPEQRSYQHSRATTIPELRAEGKYRVLTPDQCVEIAKQQGPFSTFVHAPLCGGAPPELDTLIAKMLDRRQTRPAQDEFRTAETTP